MTSACVSPRRLQRFPIPTKPSQSQPRRAFVFILRPRQRQLHQSPAEEQQRTPESAEIQLCVLRLLQGLCLFSSLLAPPPPPPPPLLAGLLPFFDDLDCHASPSPIDQ
ncbi:uncharacterized protein Triagg1_8750 [Trichoderma aggressivum f. europaeum]|uniref:Uncharacterized protein n=1 Tax=Trichoderma aggressivum f. europaeum TaxID=173218 RepID=A0AAE1I7G1_9HYPO|nr:hypothetical protein Triagg1_8750 [Trichoderma aggressivum f. europaeum]